MKKTLVLALVLATTACGVSQQKKTLQNPDTFENKLKITPKGFYANYVLTHGPLKEIKGTFTYTADRNAKLMFAPNINTQECDPKSVKYEMTWLRYDDKGQVESTTVLSDVAKKLDIASARVQIETGINYALKLRIPEAEHCSRISFAFGMHEIDSYEPDQKSLNLATGPDTATNITTPRFNKLPEAINDYTFTPDKDMELTFKSSRIEAAKCDLKNTKIELTWTPFDDKNKPVEKEKLVMKDVQKETVKAKAGLKHVLRARMSGVKDCENARLIIVAEPAAATAANGGH